MDTTDWESVLQFVADPIELDYSEKTGVRSLLPQSGGLQIPTPPQSHNGTPAVEDAAESNTLVSVSTSFYPGAQHLPIQPDTILLSSDSVFFYVHSHMLLAVSDNNFMGQLPAPPPSQSSQETCIAVPDDSVHLNIILHAVYDMSCAQYSPSFESLATAVNSLQLYGIQPKTRIAPSRPLFSLLLSYAPLFPLDLFALAASHDLYDLAVSTSSHLLSFPLATLTDEMAERIGPVYLKRLFFLHFGRSDALKRVLLPPPNPHAPTADCDFTEQKKLTRAWALASAYLAWDARPDLSTSTMEAALRPLAEHLTCEHCQQALKDRIKNLVVQWSVVKRTI
ncbi:hypothetical protein CPB83DRAFT_843075 [Crepidotus variabilis]|uniref:BTB domain-containing protein n=1 Tax=Crepidotus variabilis TaxID=179855 RepID=A0A9P6ET25_9AGAR|nr:hypothetical protein CPB83DRAFT_843075 [Crepidotus variabilis]